MLITSGLECLLDRMGTGQLNQYQYHQNLDVDHQWTAVLIRYDGQPGLCLTTHNIQHPPNPQHSPHPLHDSHHDPPPHHDPHPYHNPPPHHPHHHDPHHDPQTHHDHHPHHNAHPHQLEYALHRPVTQHSTVVALRLASLSETNGYCISI